METEIGQQQLMANNEEHLFQDVSPTRRNVKQLMNAKLTSAVS